MEKLCLPPRFPLRGLVPRSTPASQLNPHLTGLLRSFTLATSSPLLFLSFPRLNLPEKKCILFNKCKRFLELQIEYLKL